MKKIIVVPVCMMLLLSCSKEKSDIFENNQSQHGCFDEMGASKSLFSVSDAKSVHFSKGNLQFSSKGHHITADSAVQGTWRFAEHQYDIIGSGNSNKAYTEDWFDLFGWGTSGWDNGNIFYLPTSNAESSSDYYGNGYGPTNGNHSYNFDLTGLFSNADWGVYNAISNGGNEPGRWRTLTKDEWMYLMFVRKTSNIGSVANARYVKARIKDIDGTIIFPDDYVYPTDLPTPFGINNSEINFIANILTIEEWDKIESAGATFLPHAGFLFAGYDYDSGSYYWSSSSHMESDKARADALKISNDYIGISQPRRSFGCSVRLVCN